MKTTPPVLALSAALVAAPLAMAHPDAPPRSGDAPTAPAKAKKGKDKPTKGPKGTLHLVQACVVADATADGVDLKVLSANHHMRKALLKGEPEPLRVGIDATTTIRLVGRARHTDPGSELKRLPTFGDHTALTEGDRVIVRIRDTRGKAAKDLAPAFRIVDHGRAKKCAPAEPADPGTENPAPEL
jgi:hypothetical protein